MFVPAAGAGRGGLPPLYAGHEIGGSMRRRGPPAGFAVLRAGTVQVWVRQGYAFLFDRAGDLRADRPVCTGKAGPAHRGRAEMKRVSLGPAGPPCGLVRHYRRGGLLEHLFRDWYAGRGRFCREVTVTERARAEGLPTVEVLALRTERVLPGVYRADLMTREIDRATDLAAFLGTALKQDRRQAVLDMQDAVPRVAGVVRGMHDAGLFHADLNLKNLLLRGDPPARECFVIDLDKARFLPAPLDRGRRLRNLLRLYRSVEKLGFAGGAGVSLREIVRFARCYARGDRELMAACRRMMRRPPFSLKVHRFFWRLSGRGG